MTPAPAHSDIGFEPDNLHSDLGFTADQPESKGFGDHLKEYWDKINPVTGAQGLVHAALNPGEALKAYGEQTSAIAQRAEDAFKKGNYSESAAHALHYFLNGVPGIGAALDEASTKMSKGDIGGGLADTAALATNLFAPQVAVGAVRLAGKAASAAKPVVTSVLGATTGVGAKPLKMALENPSQDLVAAMRGDISESDVLGHFKEAIHNVKETRGAEYRARLAELPEGPGTSLDISPIKRSVDSELQKFGIKIDQEGELDFSRSTIRDRAAQADVKSIYEDVTSWGKQKGDRMPAGVDILKRRINDTYSPSSTARAIVQSVKDSIRDVLNTQVPGYQEMTKGYAQASEFLDHLSDLSLESKNPGTAIRKLTTTLRQNNGYRAALADALSQYSGHDLTGELAGLNLSHSAPQGLARVMDTGVGLLAAVAHGFMNPTMAVGIAAASPRLMGELMVAMSKTRPLLKQASQSVGTLALPAAATIATRPTDQQSPMQGNEQ